MDYSAFLENLNSVGPESISRGGSNIGRALREAVKAFPEENNFKVVVLLTDGEDLEKEAVATAREIAGDGIKVYSIGIGTPEGSYLKVRSENGVEEFVRDSSGQPVRSRLDETTLKKISQLTGGSYSRLNGQSLETLYNSVLATLPREERKSELQETRIDRYQWVLLAAVICLVLETLVRRRKTMPASVIAILVLLNLFGPTHSYAEEPTRELTENPVEAVEPEKLPDDPRMIYNQAHERLIEGDYTEAMNLYKTAIEQSDDIELERDGFYNMAHASNQLGEEALQAQMAARRKALEEFLKQQKSQEQQQQNDADSDQNQQKQDSKTESDKNKQENSQPSSDDSSDGQNDSQSGENPSEQQQSNESASEQEQSGSQENASDSESSSSKDNQSNESSQNRKGEEESSENPDSENSSNSSAESTANPADDMQQQDEAAVSNKDNETTSETETGETAPETSDKTDSSEGTQKATTIPESADISEVQLLLDSLRNKERLLPFEEPSDNRGQKRDTRDW